jgi:hypothetical protein
LQVISYWEGGHIDEQAPLATVTAPSLALPEPSSQI